MEVTSQLCALCFETASTDVFFEGTNVLVHQMLQTIYPQMKQTSINSLHICSRCEEILETVFHFKADCLDVDDYLRNFLNGNNKIDMRNLFPNINCPKDKKGRDKKGKICRLCLDIIWDNSFKSYSSVKMLMDICLPELDLSLTEKPIFCVKCLERLDTQRNLIINHEKKISNSQKRISNIKSDITSDCDRTEDVSNRTEGRLTTEYDIQSNNVKTDSNILTRPQKIKPRSKRSRKRNSCELQEPIDHNDNLHRCPECSYTSKESYCLELHVLLTHLDVNSRISEKNSNGVKTFTCNECTFESTRDYMMWSHILTHKDTLDMRIKKCGRCNYSCKSRAMLKKHHLTHDKVVQWQPKKINPGEMYHCTLCSMKQYKGPLMKSHIYGHLQKNITILECKRCTYKTNNSARLRLHLQSHKTCDDSLSSLNSFKCIFCQFETEEAGEFTSHCDTCRAIKCIDTFYKIVAI